MTESEYDDILYSTKFIQAEEHKFFQSLYSVILSKQGAKPTYTLFLECLITALNTPSPWTEEEVARLDLNEVLVSSPTNDYEQLVAFVLAEVSYFYRNREILYSEVSNFYDDSRYQCFDLSNLMFVTLPAFLENAENQALFSLPEVRWTDFIVLLKTLTNYQALVRLFSGDGLSVLHYLIVHPELDISNEELISLAWIAGRWRMMYSYDRRTAISGLLYPQGCHNFQAFSLYWRRHELYNMVTDSIRLAIYDQVLAHLSAHFSEEKSNNLLRAAEIFNCAYPEAVEIGNADGVFYDQNVSRLWKQFYPYRNYFEGFLGKYKIFDYEWITVAQVLWQYFRWFDSFSEEAAEYFLSKAVQLHPDIPIQFINLEYYEKYRKTDRYTLQSREGMTLYYYAEFLYYQKAAYAEALEYYEKFVVLEPQLLPNNIIPFNANSVERLIYPPSTQSALAQIAQIHLAQKNLVEAKEYAAKAIAMREENYQTPYELTAEILENEGQISEAITMYEKKINAMEATILPYYDEQQMEFYEIYTPEYGSKTIYLRDYYFKVAKLYQQIGQSSKAKEANKKASKLSRKSRTMETYGLWMSTRSK